MFLMIRNVNELLQHHLMSATENNVTDYAENCFVQFVCSLVYKLHDVLSQDIVKMLKAYCI